jgi:hypothetical protein
MADAIHTHFATHHFVAETAPQLIRQHLMPEIPGLSAHVHSTPEPTDFIDLNNMRRMVN